MIVFGIRHFKVKTYSPSEFGLTDPSWNATQFVAAQQYFHIMYIPMFPTGKFMATRGADRKLYHLGPQVAAHVKKYNLKHKTPWYTFIGPIFILLMGIGTMISDSIKSNRYREYEQERSKAYNEEANRMIDHPTTYDYYQFAIDTTGGESGYVSHQTYAVYRVVDFDNNSITFRSADENLWTYCSNPEYSAWLPLFTDTSFVTFRISKSDLRATMVSPDMDYNSDGAKINLFGKPRVFKLEKSHNLDGPEFDIYYNSSGSNVTLRIKNEGDTAKNVSFTKKSGQGNWSVTNGELVLPGDYFELSAPVDISTDFVGRIECTGAGERHHVYLISGGDNKYALNVKKLK